MVTLRAWSRRRHPIPTTRLDLDRSVTLDESYALCREINRRHGTTYYWSARVLPAVKRHHVHALYAFARYADDIVDEIPEIGGRDVSTAERERALRDLGTRLFDDLERGRSDDPVLKAVVHTVLAFDVPIDAFGRFLRSMEMDLTVDRYETWDDLLGYMGGSAAAIGEMMLPILEPVDPDRARPHARDLGLAFQLTNFLRDIDEDLLRGRVYLPQCDLRRFGVDLGARRVTPDFVALMRFEIDRCRELYRSAEVGISMLPPLSASSIGAAHRLYSGILDRIEQADYDVFSGRLAVPAHRKLAMALREFVR